MKVIPLTQGYEVMVDDDDYEWLNQWKWCVHVESDTRRYAWRREAGKIVKMHRLIIAAPDGLEVDHRDLDGLNNQRDNLRLATHAENNRNKGRRSDNKSGEPGVSWQEDRQRWYAYIRVDGKMKSLGRYVSFDDAVRVRKEAAEQFYGEFSREAS